jgi:radical SAM superfamily enzyme YgiQ (UPF0313 family)
MKPRLILINPWIYDVSAVNLWSRPLGLLTVAEFLSQYDVDLRFIDCTNISKTKRAYGAGKYPRRIVRKPAVLKSIPRNYARYGISLDTFKEQLKSHLPCDAILVTSIMSYWYPGVQKAIEIIKSLSPDAPVILGGIYATLFHRHASAYSGADFICYGSINRPTSTPFSKGEFPSEKIDILLKLLGIELNKSRTVLPYYRLSIYENYPFAPLMTSTGCPYKCSYCASSLLSSGFNQRAPSCVINEIKELYTLGVRDYAFYDDALLVNADTHLKVVLREIVKSGINVRFHCPNGLHARFIDDELAYLMKHSGFSTLRLSLETIHRGRQAQTGGKVTTGVFREAVHNLKRHGFRKEQVGAYLMYGLPGQELKEVEEGIKFLQDLDLRVNLTEFSPIPGTPCWEELISSGIISENIDPLLTNNSVFSLLFSGYNVGTLEKLKIRVKYYNNYH